MVIKATFFAPCVTLSCHHHQQLSLSLVAGGDGKKGTNLYQVPSAAAAPSMENFRAHIFMTSWRWQEESDRPSLKYLPTNSVLTSV
jgi:hypothetical protein